MLYALFLAAQQSGVSGYPTAGGRLPEVDRILSQQPDAAKKRRAVDFDQAKRRAEELAKLAGEIPAAVERVEKGLLPKDLGEQLKRIEKPPRRLPCRPMP